MSHKFRLADYRISSAKKINLKKHPTNVDPLYSSKSDYEKQLKRNVEEMRSLQDILYAHGRYSLLIIFQAMDAAGKDGSIKHVMSGINPQGCQVFSFKQPSTEELAHDFLWRSNKCLPERGRIGIFNRSYYEEVLVVRVRPELLNYQNLPRENLDDKNIWRERYEDIVAAERHLYRSGTRLLKFFLHISRDEQKKRLLARVRNAAKNWKISAADVRERERWDDYQAAYQQCIKATSKPCAPWHVIPADDKKNARLIISGIITSALRQLDMHYPKPPSKQELQSIRKALQKS
ncbi:MAG: polyphosphate kinase 2 family protein [Lentisphaerae bacterium]|nr:polyphosphate kinase 2 family protein [Lentisphaerota bacterium]